MNLEERVSKLEKEMAELKLQLEKRPEETSKQLKDAFDTNHLVSSRSVLKAIHDNS
jgi:hypothetical protein